MRHSSFPVSLMYPSRMAAEGVLRSLKYVIQKKKKNLKKGGFLWMAQDPGNIWWHMAACVYRKYTTVGRTCATHTRKQARLQSAARQGILVIIVSSLRAHQFVIHPVYRPTLETFKGADAECKKRSKVKCCSHIWHLPWKTCLRLIKGEG